MKEKREQAITAGGFNLIAILLGLTLGMTITLAAIVLTNAHTAQAHDVYHDEVHSQAIQDIIQLRTDFERQADTIEQMTTDLVSLQDIERIETGQRIDDALVLYAELLTELEGQSEIIQHMVTDLIILQDYDTLSRVNCLRLLYPEG